jgi:hypothetical protein
MPVTIPDARNSSNPHPAKTKNIVLIIIFPAVFDDQQIPQKKFIIAIKSKNHCE